MPKAFDAEHPLYLMYTSGTTAKPKGIFHTTGGYLTHVATTHRYVFDVRPETDVVWTAADIGWVTGHSYIVYGPLANGVTQVLYEGVPDAGGRDRWWRIVEEYKVTILYTAPTTIRTLMKWGDELPAAHDLSSLRVLGSVGEPINPEAWMWYREHVGGGRCPVVDTWWQTETGGIMITPLPGVTASKPGAAMRPFPGISADVVDNDGRSVGNGEGGFLVLTAPWPGMTRGIWGDPQRFIDTYWTRFEGRYFAGDGAKRDEDGDLWLLGRIDDVMNVSGHRLSTAEVEHALVGHPAVAEAAVVGASDELTGQAIVAFVTLKQAHELGGADEAPLVAELRDHVATQISPIAKPRQIILTPELPKTRSGKIMRRLLRDVAEHRDLGDVTTLTDPTVVNMIDELMADARGGRRVIEPEVAVRPAVPGDAAGDRAAARRGDAHARRRGPVRPRALRRGHGADPRRRRRRARRGLRRRGRRASARSCCSSTCSTPAARWPRSRACTSTTSTAATASARRCSTPRSSGRRRRAATACSSPRTRTAATRTASTPRTGFVPSHVGFKLRARRRARRRPSRVPDGSAARP